MRYIYLHALGRRRADGSHRIDGYGRIGSRIEDGRLERRHLDYRRDRLGLHLQRQPDVDYSNNLGIIFRPG